MESTNRIALLFSRYVRKESSPAEFEELLVWLAGYDEQEANGLSAPLQELWKQAKAGTLPSTADKVDWDHVLHNVMNSDSDGGAKIVPLHEAAPHRRIGIRVAAAAIILLLLSAGGYLLLNRRGQQPSVTVAHPAQRLPEYVLPGGDKAILTLADGSTITLDSLQNGQVTVQGNMRIVKTNGQLRYDVIAGPASTGVTGYNTVATPRGGQYQLVLPDGSKVWLNAASSIHYPTSFTGNERQVDITGEAYFEVAAGKTMPFIVNANGMQVQVLGTHFNVMAYDDEASIKTTLLEGSVRIIQGAQSGLLRPGMQARVSRADGSITVGEANTDMAVAWKEGYFYFDKDDIKTIMRQVARWYNLSIAYEGKVPEDLFSGKIERRLPLSGILHLLEKGHIHYRIEMNTLTIVQ